MVNSEYKIRIIEVIIQVCILVVLALSAWYVREYWIETQNMKKEMADQSELYRTGLQISNMPIIDFHIEKAPLHSGYVYDLFIMNKGGGPAFNVLAQTFPSSESPQKERLRSKPDQEVKPHQKKFSIIGKNEKVKFYRERSPSYKEIKFKVICRDVFKILYKWEFVGDRTRIDLKDHFIVKNKKEKKMDPANLSNWIFPLLKHPLFIACVTSGILGILVSYLGSKFQHRNWKMQDELQRKRIFEEKTFDKRAQIVRELFYLTKKREQNIWNLFHAVRRKAPQEANNYRDIDQEIISQYNALLEEIKIYFGIEEESELLDSAWQIGEIWHRIVYMLDKEKITEEHINEETKRVDELRKIIQSRLSEIMYKRDAAEPSKRYDLFSTGTSAASPSIDVNPSGTTITA